MSILDNYYGEGKSIRDKIAELEEENRNLKKEKGNIRQKLVALEKKLETLSRVKENKELREENKKLKDKFMLKLAEAYLLPPTSNQMAEYKKRNYSKWYDEIKNQMRKEIKEGK